MIIIRTLGDFEIIINGEEVTDVFKKSVKLIRLLNMLIINKNKPLFISDICDAIWDEKESNDIHKGVNNLIYRLRTLFNKYYDQPCIIYRNNAYLLNPEVNWEIDIYQMEYNMHKAMSSDMTKDEKITFLRKVIDLYKGSYVLNMICDDPGSFYMANKCERMYIDAVCILADIYMEKRDYKAVAALCERAASHEPLDDQIMLRKVQAICSQGKESQAINLLENYFHLVYRETGMQAMGSLYNLYEEILRRRTSTRAAGIDRVADELKESRTLEKALFCYYQTFKEIYRYEVRQSTRWNCEIVLLYVEIFGEKNRVLPEKMNEKAIKFLKDSCFHVLRKSDVFTDFPKNQVVIMLKTNNNASPDIVTNRLREKFYELAKGEKFYLRAEVLNDKI